MSQFKLALLANHLSRETSSCCRLLVQTKNLVNPVGQTTINVEPFLKIIIEKIFISLMYVYAYFKMFICSC